MKPEQLQNDEQALPNVFRDSGWSQGTQDFISGLADMFAKRQEIGANPWMGEDYDWGEMHQAPMTPRTVDMMSGPMSLPGGRQAGPMTTGVRLSGSVFGGVQPRITQRAGARHSRYNDISGGINRGTDFAVPVGTPVFTPAGGQWQVVEAFGGAPNKPNKAVNSGYGNSVVLKNISTGERVRMSHLAGINARLGQVLRGGELIGTSGQSGHVTGPHLDVEYIDHQGRLRDILSSPYAGSFYAG